MIKNILFLLFIGLNSILATKISMGISIPNKLKGGSSLGSIDCTTLKWAPVNKTLGGDCNCPDIKIDEKCADYIGTTHSFCTNPNGTVLYSPCMGTEKYPNGPWCAGSYSMTRPDLCNAIPPVPDGFNTSCPS